MTHGVLVIDKQRGPTSHDVVAWARRALGTRAVGHAGTLDPMATGVLVLGVGEGTKLLAHLTADDKAYETTIALGSETHTLDAEGEVVERAEVPPIDRASVERAVHAFVGTYAQRAPAVSAIKQGGVALHERVRRGEDVEAPLREVTVRSIEVLDVRADAIDLRVLAAKGFYVRSLGRDLARALGTRGHLSALRRIASGGFGGEGALPSARLREGTREEAQAHVLPLARAVLRMPRIVLDEAGIRDARHGRRIASDRVRSAVDAAAGVVAALLDEGGAVVALGEVLEDGAIRVARGIVEER